MTESTAFTTEEQHANAALIAAAPEMYEFIRGLATYPQGDILANARALLAQIEGESGQWNRQNPEGGTNA